MVMDCSLCYQTAMITQTFTFIVHSLQILGTTYYFDGDYAVLIVSPPLIPAIRIKMKRLVGKAKAR